MRKITISTSLRRLITSILICCCWHTTMQPGAVRGGREYERKQREKIRTYYGLENELAKFAEILYDAEKEALNNPLSANTATAVQAVRDAWQQVQNAINALIKTGLNPTADQQSRIDNLKNRLDILEAYVKNPPQQSRQRAQSAPAVLGGVQERPRSSSTSSIEEAVEEKEIQVGTQKLLQDLDDLKKQLSKIAQAQSLYATQAQPPYNQDFFNQRRDFLTQHEQALNEISEKMTALSPGIIRLNDKTLTAQLAVVKGICNELLTNTQNSLLSTAILSRINENITRLPSATRSKRIARAQAMQQLKSYIEASRESITQPDETVLAVLTAPLKFEVQQAAGQIAPASRKYTYKNFEDELALLPSSGSTTPARRIANHIEQLKGTEKTRAYTTFAKTVIRNFRDLTKRMEIWRVVAKVNPDLADRLTNEYAKSPATTEQPAPTPISRIPTQSRKKSIAQPQTLKRAEAGAKLLHEAIQKQAPTIEALAGNIGESEQIKDLQGLYAIMLDLQKTMLANKARLDALTRQWRTSQQISTARDQAGEILLRTSQLITEARLKVERFQKQAEGK